MGFRKIISFDWAIKTVLRDKANFGILEGFLQALLKQKIKIDALVESESNQNNKNMKYNRVDLLAVDNNGEHIIIEVQYAPENSYFKRLLYGTSKDIIDNIKVGEDYSHVKKVYSVSLVYFDVESPGKTSKDYVYYGKTEFFGLHSGKKVNINSKFLDGLKEHADQDVNIFPEYYIISLDIFDDKINDSLDEWAYSFKHHEVKDSFTSAGIKEMSQKLDYVSLDPKIQIQYDKYLMNLASERGAFGFATEKGREEGHAEGHAEGRIKEKIESLKKIFIMGLSLEQASQITGLTAAEILELRVGF